MSLRSIMAHRASKFEVVESGPKVDGEYDEDEIDGPEFRCVLFPPGTREAGRGGRVVDQPQMLHLGLDVNGGVLSLRGTDVVTVTSAPGLPDEHLGRYAVDGDQQAFGRPGRTPRGYLVLLKRAAGPPPGANA